MYSEGTVRRVPRSERKGSYNKGHGEDGRGNREVWEWKNEKVERREREWKKGGERKDGESERLMREVKREAYCRPNTLCEGLEGKTVRK